MRSAWVLLLGAWSACTWAAVAGENWPQWRGPGRNSQLAGTTAWPSDLSALRQSWRVELGPSYSGPIVYGERVFVTETADEKDEVVRALDRATGKELWQRRWPGSLSVPFFAKKNGDWIRATPACDGESLFVAGMRDTLVCLDIADGSERWRVDFPARIDSPAPAFGFVSSPLVDGEHVYVQAGGACVKLNKRNGEMVWRTLADGGGMNSSFSSPVIAELHGVRQLIVQMRQQLAGVSLDSGDVLWSQVVPSFRGMNILTPTVFQDGVFTSSYKNKSFFYRVTRKGNDFGVDEAWTLPGHGYMSSPVLIDHFVYLHLGNARLCCIDLKEGKERWRTSSFGEYWSMVAHRDRILALDQRGELILFAANPEKFELIDRKEVAQAESWAHLAVAGEQLFVRDLKGITAFEWKAAK